MLPPTRPCGGSGGAEVCNIFLKPQVTRAAPDAGGGKLAAQPLPAWRRESGAAS